MVIPATQTREVSILDDNINMYNWSNNNVRFHLSQLGCACGCTRLPSTWHLSVCLIPLFRAKTANFQKWTQIIRSKKKWYLSCSCKWSSCWGKAENPLPLYYYFVSHPPGGASADCRTSHYLREAGQTGETLCCSHQALGPFTGQSQQ